MHLRTGHTEMKTLHSLLPTLFALAGLPSVAVGADYTFASDCQIDLYETLGLLTERDCILVDSTFARTLDEFSTANDWDREPLDVVVTSQSESEEAVADDGATDAQIPTRRRQRSRRKVKIEMKSFVKTSICTDCTSDSSDLLPDDVNGRHLRGDGGVLENPLVEGGGMRRLSLSFENEFCHSLKISGFESFAPMMGCQVTCGRLNRMSVGEWVKRMYTSGEITAQQALTEPAAPPQVPTTVAGAPSYRFEGPENRVCRYSDTQPDLGGPKDILTKEKDNKYFLEIDQIGEETECQQLCLAKGDDCCGYEYSKFYQQCELWKSSAGIGYMKPVSGYTCKEKKLDSPSEAPPEVVPLTVTGSHYHGKADRACRSDPKDPNKGGPLDDEAVGLDNKYFNVAPKDEGISTLGACQARCSANPHCIGVEWSESLKRCENWKDIAPGGIGWMEQVEGFECYHRSVTPYDPVFQYGAVWEDDDDDEDQGATRAYRFEMGAQWCDGPAASNVFVSGHDIEGFQWGKVCGGFRYQETGYASYVMGMHVDKVEELPEAVKADVLTYSADVSNCWRKWSQIRAMNGGQHPS